MTLQCSSRRLRRVQPKFDESHIHKYILSYKTEPPHDDGACPALSRLCTIESEDKRHHRDKNLRRREGYLSHERPLGDR
jgi:hypothetical protein